MAYDEQVGRTHPRAGRRGPGLTEKRVLGGLACLVGGHIAVPARDDDIMIRADAGVVDELVSSGEAEPVIMLRRPIHGWLTGASARLRADEQLARWAALGAEYERTLPPG